MDELSLYDLLLGASAVPLPRARPQGRPQAVPLPRPRPRRPVQLDSIDINDLGLPLVYDDWIAAKRRGQGVTQMPRRPIEIPPEVLLELLGYSGPMNLGRVYDPSWVLNSEPRREIGL